MSPEVYAKNPELYRSRSREWAARNREKVHARTAAFRAANAERLRAKRLEVFANNREQINERKRVWRAANPAPSRARTSAWKAANAERVAAYGAAYRLAHPEAKRADSMRRRALERTQGIGDVTADDIRAVFASTNGTCIYCGDVATTIDHVVPLERGGAHAVHNLSPACKSCNSSKGKKLLGEWKRGQR